MQAYGQNTGFGTGTTQRIITKPLFGLVLVNLVFFVTIKILIVSGLNYEASTIINYTALPLNFGEFILKPWTLFTYMFVHEGLLHFIFNILGLIIFGNLLSFFTGNRNAIPVYIAGGILGGIFAMLFRYLPIAAPFLQNSILIGASAGVMGIVLAATFYMPDQIVKLYYLFPIKMKYLGLGMLALDVISILLLNNAGGHISHLGGALAGYLFISNFKNKSRAMVWIQDVFRKRELERKVEINKAYHRPINDDEYNELKLSKSERLDLILEKIHRNGISCLSKRERDFLERVSKEV